MVTVVWPVSPIITLLVNISEIIERVKSKELSLYSVLSLICTVTVAVVIPAGKATR